MKSWLNRNDTKMYSAHNEGKSVVSKRFIRTLENKIYKYMTSLSKNVCIDKLNDIVNKYSNKYHRAIGVKPADLRPSIYIDFNKAINDKNSKFKIGDIVRISKLGTLLKTWKIF